MTLLEDLLVQQARVVSVSPTATVRDAAKAMAGADCGSVMVMEGARVVGIFTERDLMKRVLLHDLDLDRVPVATVMTSELVFATARDGVAAALQSMQEHHIRHLPVMDGSELVGVLSIRDLIHESLEDMRAYIACSEG